MDDRVANRVRNGGQDVDGEQAVREAVPARRRRRSRLDDVAEAAGVSVATVDRALNGRPGVRAETRARIERIATALGYRPDPAASSLARRTTLRFTFLLPPRTTAFLDSLHAEAARAIEWLAPRGVRAAIHEVDVFDAGLLAAAIRAAGEACDGLAIVALDDPRVRDAIDAVSDAGVAVVTLVSDCPGSRRRGFAGIDNTAAGRTAGSLLGRFLAGRSGEIAVIVGSRRLRDHSERVLGLRQVIGAEYPDLTLLPEIEGRDDAALNRAALSRLLAERPGIVGLYNAGAGNRGVIAALTESGRVAETVFVGHELTWVSRAALLDGVMDAAINQDRGHETRSAARQLLAFVAGEPLIPEQERIRIDIYIRDNLP